MLSVTADLSLTVTWARKGLTDTSRRRGENTLRACLCACCRNDGSRWTTRRHRDHHDRPSNRPLQEHIMRPLRYSINVTLDGCCDHRAMFADEDLHRHAVENLEQADALLFGRVTYEMMEAAWRPPAQPGARPDWMEPFARTIGVAKKYVVSSTLDRVDWNAELVRGDVGQAVQQLKRESGKGTARGRREAPAGVGGAGIDR